MRRFLIAFTAVLFSAALQTAIFPVAGPLPFVRAQFAWIALVPWLAVMFACANKAQRPLLRVTLWSYACGVLWYAGHCYWIFQTMHRYGNLSKPVAAVVLLLFCMYLGLYHALFGLIAALLWRAFHTRWKPMVLSILLSCAWVAVELARARVTSFPWDLLGYSQIDNAALTQLAPWAGVYAIGFLVVLTNVGLSIALNHRLLARSSAAFTLRHSREIKILTFASLGIAVVSIVSGVLFQANRPAATNRAMAVQPNLDQLAENSVGSTQPPLEDQLAAVSASALHDADGVPPTLILWPEAPTPFELHEPHLQSVVTELAAQHRATVIIDANAVDRNSTASRRYNLFNAAALFTASGLHARYDKIHLVPFGEFMPFSSLLGFASGLTQQVGLFDRGTRRTPLADGLHRYGVFICYESIFPEEVRQLAARGAEVFVNLSDDGWYGDTSAPFQHSNMARMRAIENRRWLLRDTNNGITESIDPYGNVRVAGPRHQRLAFSLPYAYASDMTFYTRYGDVFAWTCVIFTMAAFLASFRWSAAAVDLPPR